MQIKTHRVQINEILQKYIDKQRLYEYTTESLLELLQDEIMDIDACVNMED